MATLIRLKRRTSDSDSDVKLQAGEAFYNAHTKQLFIGNSDDESVSGKKHIAQITHLSAADDKIKFTVGEHPDNNLFEKTINNVANAHNLDTSISGKNLTDIFRYDSGKPVASLSSDNLTNLKLNLDSSTNTISLSWGDNDQYGGGEDEKVCLDGLTIEGSMERATQLETSRELITALDSATAANFNGTENVDIGVKGTLPLEHGGTGATTAPAVLQNLGLTATADELNTLDGITATTAELNVLDGITASTAELNYVDGVTSSIQAQLDTKQPKDVGTASRVVVSGTDKNITVSAITTSELNKLDGVTDNIQDKLDEHSNLLTWQTF